MVPENTPPHSALKPDHTPAVSLAPNAHTLRQKCMHPHYTSQPWWYLWLSLCILSKLLADLPAGRRLAA